jgi:hypothetical protein
VAAYAHPSAVRTTSSINSASIPDLRNVTIASVGVHMIASLLLNDALTTIGARHQAFKNACVWEA